MDLTFKEHFISLWQKYFGQAELPVAFYYSETDGRAGHAGIPHGWRCLIGELAKVRNGKPLAFNAASVTCGGGKRYLGYTDRMRPDFEYFLSCGNKSVEGERYKQTPELVKEIMKNQQNLYKTGKNIIFKRWDQLTEDDSPEAVIFFAKPDVLSGLFTLANFDQVNPDGVIAPFGAGCGSIVHYPYLEGLTDHPKAVLGMFDPSARPYVAADEMTFAIPMKKFVKMVDNMEESFLITPTWEKMKARINKI